MPYSYRTADNEHVQHSVYFSLVYGGIGRDKVGADINEIMFEGEMKGSLLSIYQMAGRRWG